MISKEFKSIGKRMLRASNKNTIIFQTIQRNQRQHETLYSTKALLSKQSLIKSSVRNPYPFSEARYFSTLDHPASGIFHPVTHQDPSQKKQFQILSPSAVEMIKSDFKVCVINIFNLHLPLFALLLMFSSRALY